MYYILFIAFTLRWEMDAVVPTLTYSTSKKLHDIYTNVPIALDLVSNMLHESQILISTREPEMLQTCSEEQVHEWMNEWICHAYVHMHDKLAKDNLLGMVW